MFKTPTYSPREQEALRCACSVVARVRINQEWKEHVFTPEGTETVRDCLVRVQHALRHHRDFSGIVLYVEGTNGMRANVPHDWIPTEMEK